MSDNPATILFDINGNPMAVSGGMALPTGTIGLMMAAVDSNGFVRFLSTVSGSLEVTGSVIAQVTFPGNQQVWQQGPVGVSGSVALTNWPAVIGVSASAPVQVWTEGPLGVSGTVGVSNFPATQNVSGTVFVTQTGSFHVTVDNPTPPPANQQVWQAGTVGVSGTVQVWSEGPLPVSGTVSVSQPVQVYSSGTLGVSGSVAITNWPATVGVSGSVGVTNFPATQNVSGTVFVTQTGSFHVTVDNSELAVSNFPATQAVSGSVSVYTTGLQGVSGTVQVWSEGPLPVSGAVALTNWPVTIGISASANIPVTWAGSGSLPVYPGDGAIFTVQGNVPTGSVAGAFPVHVAGTDSNGIKRSILTDTAGATYVTSSFTKPLYNYPTSQRITVMSGAVLTSNGSQLINMWPAWSEWYLIANMSGAVGGTNPTIQFYVDQVDPIDRVTPITTRVSGSVLTGSGVSNFQVVDTNSDTFIIGWIITGTNPFFSGVNVSWVGRAAGSAIEGQAPVASTAEDPPVLVAGADTQGFVRYLLLDTQGRLVTAPAGAGASPGYTFGDIALSAITSSVFVARTTYVEPTSSAGRSVVSTSTSDRPGFTGAAKVTLTYYDVSGSGPFSEVVTLNGTTPVNTVNTNICYIEDMLVSFVGSNGSNVGVISLKGATGGGGPTIASIGVGDNQTFFSQHYVPLGKTTYVTDMSVSVNGGAASFVLKQKPINVTGSVEQQISESMRESAQAPTTPRNYGTALVVFGPARIRGYVTTEAATALTYRHAFSFYDQ